MTQGFFTQFLAKGWLGRAEQGKGRFRAFLKTLVNRYALDETVRAAKQKRFEAGFVSVEHLIRDEDRTYEPASGETPDDAFDRQWKTELLAIVRRNLQETYEATGKSDDVTRYAVFAAYHFVDKVEAQPTQEQLADRRHWFAIVYSGSRIVFPGFANRLLRFANRFPRVRKASPWENDSRT